MPAVVSRSADKLDKIAVPDEMGVQEDGHARFKNVASSKTLRDTGSDVVKGQARGLKAIIAKYAQIAQRSEELGQSFKIEITVIPNQEPVIVTHPAGDALDQAIARAKERGAKHIAEILRAPDMLNARDFGKLVGASHETVNKWRQAGLVLALEGQTRGYRYPRWQVTDDGRIVPGLKTIAEELGDPWIVHRFLLQSHPELKGQTALECLKSGEEKAVIGTARAIAQGSFA